MLVLESSCVVVCPTVCRMVSYCVELCRHEPCVRYGMCTGELEGDVGSEAYTGGGSQEGTGISMCMTIYPPLFVLIYWPSERVRVRKSKIKGKIERAIRTDRTTREIVSMRERASEC